MFLQLRYWYLLTPVAASEAGSTRRRSLASHPVRGACRRKRKLVALQQGECCAGRLHLQTEGLHRVGHVCPCLRMGSYYIPPVNFGLVEDNL